ncbi:macro domain-containing protein ['Paenibacillus yunnanensis' Narsing Rao et al. 2020]|uniref:macro domain-containing protein n=1 Tax=Paenibacillus tengchongensis TaxID=2608684 RepID=UPI00124CDA3F|nr:macro domain-containing protein [Paenibacillus tengchongensis]
MQVHIEQVLLEVIEGDITRWQGDYIVNAANSGLYGGGGVDGAIHRAGGRRIAEECAAIRQRQGKVLPGDAALTSAGSLPFRGIIHTVGPIWKGGSANETAVLAECYSTSLNLACAEGAQSIAFPNIGTGVYNFPKSAAAQIAVTSVVRFIREKTAANMPLKRIAFVCFEPDNAAIYRELLESCR